MYRAADKQGGSLSDLVAGKSTDVLDKKHKNQNSTRTLVKFDQIYSSGTLVADVSNASYWSTMANVNSVDNTSNIFLVVSNLSLSLPFFYSNVTSTKCNV